MITNKNPHLGTLAVWAGEDKDFPLSATQVPIVHSVAFGYDDVDHWIRVALGEQPGHIYSRNSNPTVEEVVQRNSG